MTSVVWTVTGAAGTVWPVEIALSRAVVHVFQGHVPIVGTEAIAHLVVTIGEEAG